MSKKLLLIFSFFLLTSCAGPKYIEKNSEALSQTVFATQDSLKAGRIDLANKYSDQEIKLVNPPKVRLSIQPIKNKIILPANLKDDKAIFVDSTEYNDLLANKELAAQLQQENNSLTNHIDAVNAQMAKNHEIQSELLNDYNNSVLKVSELEKKLVQKELSLWMHRAIILFLLTTFGICVFLRIKGIL